MEYRNQADEYHRLQELYAEMSDEEIEAMSGQMQNLTDIARGVLRAEISRRRLGPQGLDPEEDPREVARRALREQQAEREMAARGNAARDGPGDASELSDSPHVTNLVNLRSPDPLMGGFDPQAYDLVAIWNAGDASEAREIMHVLDVVGITAYLGPENAERLDDYKGSYEDGVAIKVMKFQGRFALDGLHRLFPPKEEEARSNLADYAIFCPTCNSREVIFVGLDVQPEAEPAAGARYNWLCDVCGCEWKDDGIAKATGVE